MAKGDNDVQVHTSLPPFVPGEIKGTITLRFPVLKWDCATPPPAPRLNVHLKWWGERTEGCVFRVPIEYRDKLHPSINPSTACYNIQSNWKKFKSYLQDMGHLSLVVGLGRTSEDILVMGECAVPNMASITPGQLETRTCAVNTSDGAVHLGRLVIELSVKMKDRLTRKSRKSAKRDGTYPSSVVASPLRGIEKENDPINLVTTVPVSNKEWRPVKQVDARSKNVTSNGEALNSVGRQLLCQLIEQTKSLHSRVVAATDNGRVQHCHGNQDSKKEKNDSKEKMVQEDVPDPVELTPPASPSESMMEIVTTLACDSKNIEQPVRESIPVKQCSEPLDHTHQSRDPPKISFQLPPIHIGYPSQRQALNCTPKLPNSFVGNCSTKEPELFHLLLEVSEGSGLVKSSDPTSLPSSYIQCRLFCLEMPIHSKVFPETNCPKINMKQIFPVFMDWNELLERLQRGYAVIEVWHGSLDMATAESMEDDDHDDNTIEDELIGLVKVSLYPFYAAVVCSIQKPSHKQSLFPVVAVDGCCPVRDPLSGSTRGYLNMKLVMGTPSSIPATLNVPIPSQDEPTVNQSQDNTTTEITMSTEDDQSNQLIEEETMADETHNECGRHANPSPLVDAGSPPKVTTVSVASGNETIQIDLLISQAMHLPLLATPLGKKDSVPPSTYVTCHLHPDVTKISTAICEGTQSPYWDYHCTTGIPKSFIEASFSELEFQVWSVPPPLPQDCANRIELEVHSKSHIFIGRAYVDLIPLQYGLRTIAGWYNITDLAGEIRGQVKIAITPHDLVVPRREGLSSSFYSRSILPLEVELCSQSLVPPSTISFAPPTSINIPKSCETKVTVNGCHSNDDQSLTILRQQLQAHVADLEIIQDCLEAKLKENSPTSARPHPSVIASHETPPISTNSHPLTPPPLSSPSPASSSNTVISSLNKSPQSMGGWEDSRLTTPTTQSLTTPTQQSLTTPIQQAHNHMTSTPPLTMPTTEQHINLTTPTDHMTSTPHLTTPTTMTIINDSVTMTTSINEVMPTFTDIDHLISTDKLPIIKATPTDIDMPPHNHCSTPLLVTDTPTFEDPSLQDMPTSIVHTSTDNTKELPILKPHPSLVLSSNDNSISYDDNVVNKQLLRDNRQNQSSGIDFSALLEENEVISSTNQISSFMSPLAIPNDENPSSSSDSNISVGDLRNKVVAMATVEDGRVSANTTTEDTSIIVDTTPTKGHTHISSNDDSTDEEEEVKRLFDQLLKEPGSHERHLNHHHSDEDSTTGSTSSSTTSSIILEAPPTRDGRMNPETTNSNIDTSQPLTRRSYSMSDCRLPDSTLADKLLNLRRSVLSRRPPRPRPSKPLPPRKDHSLNHKY